MKIIDNQTVKIIDQYLVSELGFKMDLLVEHAGMAIHKHANEYLDKRLGDSNKRKRKINVLFGKGNNGLDVLVSARLMFADGFDVTLWQAFSDDNYSSKQLDICTNIGIKLFNAQDFKPVEDEILVEGIFGSSFDSSRQISSELNTLLQNINKSRDKGSIIISADIPSGVDASFGNVIENAVKADLTIAFIFPKFGNVSNPGKLNNGKLVIDSLNLPIEFIESKIFDGNKTMNELIDQNYVNKYFTKRTADGHKGTFGKIGIIAGSLDSPGAAILSSLAAMKAGSGLIYLSVPESIKQDCIVAIPEAVISSKTSDAMDKSDVLLIGPGLDESKENLDIIIKAILNHQKLVLDAGALNLLSVNMKIATEAFKERYNKGLPRVILTPHPKEFDRLFPGSLNENRIEIARNGAEKLKSVVVLKGNATIVCDELGNTNINTSGNSALAKGGSGDVLAGIIAAMYKHTSKAIQAASIGVFIHGATGDMLSIQNSEYSVLPTELIKALPTYFNNLDSHKVQR